MGDGKGVLSLSLACWLSGWALELTAAVTSTGMWPKYRSRNQTDRQRERERESVLVKLESINPVNFKASILSSFLWFCEPVNSTFLLNLAWAWTSTSYQGGVKGAKFTHPPETTKNLDKIFFLNSHFRDIGHKA